MNAGNAHRGWGLRAALLLAAGLVAGTLSANGNIDPANKFAWSANAGWVNFAPSNGGVTVSATALSGYAWAENIGWIKLGADGGGPYLNTTASNYGVNRLSDGSLSGFAWSKTCGWVNFSPGLSQVTVNPSTGSFDGYAWSENLGWIHFKNATPAYNVKTTATFSKGTIISFW